MSELQKSQSANEPEALVESKAEKANSNSTTQHIANIQNNFHFTQNIDLDKMSSLSEISPEIASRMMSLYEQQFEHAKAVDNKIIELEKTEQKARVEEIPFQRKFAFRSLNYALLISLSSLGFAAYCASIGADVLAGIGITVPISVAVANMLGFKAAKQQKIPQNSEDN